MQRERTSDGAGVQRRRRSSLVRSRIRDSRTRCSAESVCCDSVSGHTNARTGAMPLRRSPSINEVVLFGLDEGPHELRLDEFDLMADGGQVVRHMVGAGAGFHDHGAKSQPIGKIEAASATIYRAFADKSRSLRWNSLQCMPVTVPTLRQLQSSVTCDGGSLSLGPPGHRAKATCHWPQAW